MRYGGQGSACCSDRVAMLYNRKFPYIGTPDELWNHSAPEVSDFIQGNFYEDKD